MYGCIYLNNWHSVLCISWAQVDGTSSIGLAWLICRSLTCMASTIDIMSVKPIKIKPCPRSAPILILYTIDRWKINSRWINWQLYHNLSPNPTQENKGWMCNLNFLYESWFWIDKETMRKKIRKARRKGEDHMIEDHLICNL